MSKSIRSELLPETNCAIKGEGVVVAHERILDCTGRFYGLRRLVVDGGQKHPDVEKWLEFLPKDVDVKMMLKSQRGHVTTIFYRLWQDGHLTSFNERE